jgi:hypothetical protein
MQGRMHHTWQDLNSTSETQLCKHLPITRLTPNDWDMVDSFTIAQAHITLVAATHTQQQKFELLYITQHQVDRVDNREVMVNLSILWLYPS